MSIFKRIPVFVIFLTAFSFTQAQNISQIIVQPHALQTVGDTVAVSVWVPPTLSVTVTATAYHPVTSDMVRITLTYDVSSGLYTGRLPFTGFPAGDHTIFIATSSGFPAQVTVTYNPSLVITADALPQIILTRPLSHAVANPVIPLRIKALDNTDSTRLVISVYNVADMLYTVAGTWWDSVGDLDLSAWNGKSIYLLVQAIDSSNQTTVINPIPMYVETSSYLVKYFESNGLILDFNYNKLLVVDDAQQSNPRIITVPGGAITAIPLTGRVNEGRLTPQGAVLTKHIASTTFDSLYDYNNGTLLPVDIAKKGTLKVAGAYGIWAKGVNTVFNCITTDSLFRRNFITQTNDLITPAAANTVITTANKNSVAADGSVVYIDSLGSVMNDQRTLTTFERISCTEQFSINPVHDSISYAFTSIFDARFTTFGWSRGNINIGTANVPRQPEGDYQVRGKYFAYVKFPVALFTGSEVYRTDTLGNTSLITSTATGRAQIELLSPGGSLTLTRGGKRAFVSQAGTLTDVSSMFGKAYYRDSTWYIAIGNTLFWLHGSLYMSPPADPSISGLAASYCDNLGTQKVKVTNWPAGPLTTVSATLGGASLVVNAVDSSVSFNVGGLAAGVHTLTVTFTNMAGTNDTSASFNVVTAVSPDVHITANITQVVNLTDPVIVTASNVAGGGTTPLYTFARDRNFTNVLQAEGTAAILTLAPSTLVIGDNKIYVRMKSSATCYTAQTNIDSIVLTRDAATGIVDADNPGQTIVLSPNPFDHRIAVSGLSSGKVYRIVLYNARGQAIYTSEVKNKRILEIPAAGIMPGIYWLSIYDAKKKLIGTEKVVKY